MFESSSDDGLVFTSRQVMDSELPILLVTHDSEDGAWQFVQGTETDNPAENGVLVHPEHLVEWDASVAELADLPRGWIAWRPTAADPWIREPERHSLHDRHRELRDELRFLPHRVLRRVRRRTS